MRTERELMRITDKMLNMRLYYTLLFCFVLLFGSIGNVQSQRSFNVGAEQLFADTAAIVRTARLDAEHFVVLYKRGSVSSATDLYARVGEVDSANQTISWGATTFVESAINLRSTVVSLNSNQVIVAYEWSDGEAELGVARVLTVDLTQDTIGVGDTVVFHNSPIDPAFSHTPISMTRLNDARVAICFADDFTDDGQVVIGDVSGSSVSFGAAQEWSSGNVHNFWIDALTETEVIISYEDDGSTNDVGKAIIGSISGQSISYGSAYSFYDAGATNSISYTAVKSVDSTKAVIAYTRDGVNKGYAVVASISGSVINYGTHLLLSSEVSSAGPRDITICNSFGAVSGDQEVAVGYHTGSSDTAYISNLSVSGTTLSVNTQKFFASEADDSWLININENILVIGFVDDGNGDKGRAQVIKLSPSYAEVLSSYSSSIPGSGSALDFDGSNDYVDIGNVPELTFDTAMTIEFWFNTTDAVGNYNSLVSKWYSGGDVNGGSYSFYYTNSGLQFALQDTSNGSLSVPSNNFYNDGKWHHAAGTWNGDTAKLYIDGRLVGSNAQSGFHVLDQDSRKTFIGSDDRYTPGTGDRHYEGKIDEVRFWRTPLDIGTIRDWMCQKVQSTHPSFSDLEGYYRFDQGQGTTLYDLQGNNNGTLINMDPSTDWIGSSAPIGDESKFIYGAASIEDTLANGNIVRYQNLRGNVHGIHLYKVNASPIGSTYPGWTNGIDSSEYFGAFLVGGKSYDVIIDYSSNAGINGTVNEALAIGLKRAGGGDDTWEAASGMFQIDETNNIIRILYQSGTEYVTGFANTTYPTRAGSGYTLDFDGSDDGIVSSNGGMSGMSTADSITVEAWFNSEDTTAFPFIYDSEEANSAAFRILFTSGQLRISIREALDSGGISIKTDSSFNDGQWHHVAFTYNGSLGPGGMNIYVDGVDVPTSWVANLSTNVANYSDSVYVGINRDMTWALDGRIDELRVWNSVLSQTTVRDWMTKKLTSSHVAINDLISYHRFDEGSGDTLFDLAGGATGILTNFDAGTEWQGSGAALGDESFYTYGGNSISDTLSNSNVITLNGFGDADGMHLYFVNDPAEGSSFPSTIINQDSAQYFGAFMVNGSSYDVSIDYSNNNTINGQSNELDVRALKRSGGDDGDWEVATGYFGTNASVNTISIPNQTGTEYVTGFSNTSYPERPGSGYSLEFDGSNDRIDVTKVPLLDGLTYAAWIKTTSTDATSGYAGNAALNVIGDHTNNVWVGFGVHGGFARYNHYTGSWQNLTGTTSINDGKWHHIAVSHSKSTGVVRLYVDGALDASANYTYGGGGGALKVGYDRISGGFVDASATQDFFDGIIDEVAIWSTDLDSNQIREWMCKKINASHDSIDNLVAYYRFDDGSSTTLEDLVGGNDGTLTNMDANTDWIRSGAALGDESYYIYDGSTLSDTLSNNNVITLDDFAGASGMHLYFVSEAPDGSTIPGSIINPDTNAYFGAFMVGGTSYDVTIDYSDNNTINGQANEQLVRGLKRSGGDDGNWVLATGYFGTDSSSNQISIPNQTGTEYVTGFTNTAYPERAGSGYALDFDGTNDLVNIGATIANVAGAFTLEFWYQGTSDIPEVVFATGIANSTLDHSAIVLGPSSGSLTNEIVSFGKVTSSGFTAIACTSSDRSILYDGNWHHISVSYDGSTTYGFLIDGKVYPTVVGSATAGYGFNVSSPDYGYIGGRYYNSSLNAPIDGRLDEIRLWSSDNDSTIIREWMTKKINASHDSLSNLEAYYRFDDAQGTTLFDLVGGNNGTLTNMDTTTDWVYSGAALGDESVNTYGGNVLVETLSNNNEITVDGFQGADGIHLYVVNDTAEGSTFPATLDSTSNDPYFGVFMVGGSSYDVTIDYSNNTSVNGVANEDRLRGVKRSGGDDSTWEEATGILGTNIDSNTISILNQTGTEYVTGFTNTVYPVRPGSGYALDFDGANDYVTMGDVSAVEGQSQLTIEAWIKPESFSNFRGIVSKFGGSASVALDLTAGGSTVGTSQDIFFRVANGANSYGHTTNEPMQADEWLHVAAVFDGTQATNNDRITLYVNGVSQSLTYNGTFPSTTSSNSGSLEIGRYQSLYEFDGSIDEVRIWHSALTQDLVREWMTKKLTSAHDSINELAAYYRFDESEGSTLFDLVSGLNGDLTNMDTTTDWVYSGAALGDENKFTYSATQVIDTLSNGNEITLDDFAGADGIHLYQVNDTVEGSSYPTAFPDRDTTNYFGVFLVGGHTYDVTLDYSNNTGISAAANEADVRTMRRSGGDDATWERATGALRTDVSANTISILNQSGTEYVTGFTDTLYPARAGSGYALDFDGVDDRVTIPYDPTLDFDSNDFSVSAWVRLDETPADLYPMITGWRTSGANGFLLFAQAGSRYVTAQIGGVNYTSSTAINDALWHNVTFSRISGNCTIYVDGVSVHTFSAPSSVNATIDRYIGNEPQNASQSYFQGRIDEFSIWNTGLDSISVRDWMCKKINASNTNLDNLVAYYRFDEASGSTLQDLEGGNDATLTNMDATTDWVRSGAAIGDSSSYTYGGTTLSRSLTVGADVNVSDFDDATGMHIYTANGVAEGSTYPLTTAAIDSNEYFGVFQVGGASHDVEIDYSGAASITSLSNENNLRTLNRTSGESSAWSVAHGELFVDTAANDIAMFNRQNNEYVIGINSNGYPRRPGSGYALDFDGSNDYVALSSTSTTVSPTSLGLPDSAITVEAWVNVDNFSDWRSIVHFFQDNGASEYGWTMSTRATGQFSFALAGGGVGHTHLITSNVFNTNQWYHVAVVYDGSLMSIYVDGVLEATSTNESGDIAYINSNFRIGKYEDNDEDYYFDGNIEEVRIWNVALDSNTIRDWMTKKLNMSHSRIDAINRYYRFDEAQGSVLEDIAAGYIDTLTNMDPTTDWLPSGAAIGDESKNTYGGTVLVDTLSNNNEITLDGFSGADGIHLYRVNESPVGSSYPVGIDIATVDSTGYFGVFKVGGTSYDVTIDYTNNTNINGTTNEQRVRGIKRSGGDDASWSVTTGELRTNTNANTISIFNQTGTEYVTGFATLDYPSRPGSGYALDFDGSDDQIYIGDILGDEGDFTISTWFNSNVIPTGINQEGLFVRGNDGSGAGWSIAAFLQSDSTIRGAIVHSGGVQVNADATTKITPGDWHHLALTFDSASGDLRLYLDGIEEGSANSTNSTLRSSTLGNFIGRGNLAAEAFDGKLDEFAIWNVALDTTAIRDWICRKVDSTHQEFGNLMAYYRFDESVNDTLIDLVGGNDGPLANMAMNDWELSGASIGDTSVYDYSAATVTMSYVDGDILHVAPFSGNPEAIHVYRIDEAPNNTTVPLGASSLDTTHYYGFFMAGGSSPRGYVYMDYENNANYTSIANGDQLLFVGRDGNDDDFSTKASAIFTNLVNSDSLLLFSQSSGTEVMAAQSGYLTPPGSGYALELDGTGEYVEIPDDNAFDVNAVTIETWVYWEGGSAVEFISAKSTEELELHINEAGLGIDSTFRFIPTTDVYIDAPALSFLPNKWHHVAAVYDPSQSLGEIYIDGIAQNAVSTGTNPLSTAITTSASPFYLGQRADGSFPFSGQLDEFRIWNTVLDSTVIRKWMSRKLDNTHDSISNLIAYYRFDQLGDTNLIDLIGGNHGELNNMDETTDWVTSGAAIGDMSVFTYGGTSLSIQEPTGDSLLLNGFETGIQGAQLYYVAERSNSSDFYGAQSTDTNYYFGVHKVGADTATYDVTYYYGNSSKLTGSSNEFRVALAKRENNADGSWEADWFNGSTDVTNDMVFLPNQTGTEYAGIVSANNALNFDGGNDFVSIPDAGQINFDTQEDLTVEAWVNIPATNQPDATNTTNEILIKWNGGGGPIPYALRYNNQTSSNPGTVRAVQHDGTTGSAATSTTAINDGLWHHLAMVKSGDNIYIYVDGIAEDTATDVSTLTTLNSVTLKIGGQGTNRSLDGSVDEVRIWRRALCEDEILARLSCQLDTNGQDSLVAYYSFNQGVADSTNTGLDSLIDLSGNTNHGTLNNLALSGTSSNWTAGTTAITGSCSPYTSPIAIVVSEGDTILSGDTLATTADSTDFGDVILNETHYVNYSILNDGGDTLDIDSVFFTGQNSTFFFALHSNQVAPGDTGFISVQVTPTTQDSIWAILNIATNQCSNSPYSFRMQGNVLGNAGALNFDGINDHVLIPDTLGELGLDEFTVESWVRVEATTGTLQAIFSSTGTEMFHFQLHNSGSSNNVFYTDAGIISLPIIPETPLGVWKHVAMVAKSGESRVYVNGTQLGATQTATYDSILVTNNLRIGSGFGASRFFNGDIDEVRLWNRALDSTEIQANMNCELEGTECGLIAYYNFNSDTAIIQGTNTGLTVLTDSSGNGKDGSLINFGLNADSSNWVAQSDSILNNCIDNGDLVGPIVIPVETLDVWINNGGYALIDSAIADSASCDYYSGIQAFSLSTDSVTCANDGDTLWLTATDSAGLADSSMFIVRVRDSIPPTAIARTQILYLDTNGNAVTSADSTDNGSFDQCLGIDSIGISQDSFNCSDLTTLNAPAINAFSASVLLYGSGPGAQTFVPTVSGFLSVATVYLRKTSAGTATRTIQIIEGDPNQSTIEVSQTFTLPQNVLGGQQNITFTNPPYLIAGNTYSIKLPDLANTTEGAGYAPLAGYAFGDRWTGTGTMTADNGSDLYFVTYIATASNVQTTVLTAVDSSGNSATDTSYIAILDTIRPTAYGQNVTIALDTNGSAILTPAMFDSTSTDNCGIDSLSIDADTVDCSLIGSFNVNFKVFDASGNVDSLTLLATVIDTTNPTAIGQTVTAVLDSSGNAIVSVDSVNNGSTDNCAIDSLWLSDTLFTCGDTGGTATTILVVQDASGNVDSAVVTVIVQDTTPPQFALNNPNPGGLNIGIVGTFANAFQSAFATSFTGAGYNVVFNQSTVPNAATLDQADLIFLLRVNGNTDVVNWVNNGGFVVGEWGASAWTFAAGLINASDGGSFNQGSTVGWNLTSTSLATVLGQGISNTSNISTGSSFYRGVTASTGAEVHALRAGTSNPLIVGQAYGSGYAMGNSGAWIDIGSGYASSDMETMWLNLAAYLAGQQSSNSMDTTLYLTQSGIVVLTPSQVLDTAYDNCAIDSIWMTDTLFACADTSGTEVKLFLRDESGNIDSATLNISIDDTLPAQIVTQDTFIYLDTSGQAIVTVAHIDSGSADNCGIDSMYVSPSVLSCVDTSGAVVYLVVIDSGGNIDSAAANIDVRDSIPPTLYTQNITVYLDTTGNVNIVPSAVDSATTDNCGVASISLSDSSFTCLDTGSNSIFFYATDSAGNSDSVQVTVNVLDTILPNVLTQDITVYLGAGGFTTIDTSDVLLGANDNCVIDSMYLSVDSFFCSSVDTSGGGGFNNTGIYWSNFGTGQVRSANNDGTSATNILSSQTTPSAAAYDISDDKVYWLNNSGGNVMRADGNGSNIQTLVTGGTSPRDIVVDPDNDKIYWSDFNAGTIRSANTDGTSVTTLASSIGPLGIWLDRTNQEIYWADLTASSVRKMNVDGTGVTTVVSSQSDIRDVAYDATNDALYWTRGSSSTISKKVGAAAATTFKSGLTQVYGIFLDEGLGRVIWSQTGTSNIIQGCDLDGTNQSTLVSGLNNPVYLSFGQSAVSTGPSTVLTVVDGSGNTTTTTVNVTVEDTLAPVVIAQSVTVSLDSNGAASIDTADINFSSIDNCQIDTMWLSQSNFTCADTNGIIDTLFVQDVNGNIGWDTTLIYINDTTAPYLNLATNTLYLDTNGQLTLSYADLISTETEYFIQQSDLSNWSTYTSCSGFTRLISQAGLETWTWNDNLAAGTQIDSAKIELNWGFSGTSATRPYALNGNGLGSSPGPNFGSCAWGQISFDLDTAYYNVGGSNSFTWDIIASTYVIFPNPDWSGAYAKVTVYSSVVFDNCSDSSQITYILSDSSYNCTDTGTNTVVVTGIDLSGNSITDSTTFTLLDTVSPRSVPRNFTVYLDTTGIAVLFADSVDSNSTDNCQIDSIWVSTDTFYCSNTSTTNMVALFAMDGSGNIDSDSALITVMDTVRPTPIPKDVTVYLDSTGTVVLTADSVDDGSFDTCGIDSIWIADTLFACADTANPDTILFFARDVNGNIDSARFAVTTVDTIDPIVVPRNLTVYLDTGGLVVFTADTIDSASYDNCEVDSIWLSDTSFACIDSNDNNVTLFVRDVSGNIASGVSVVTVLDTVSPVVQTQPRTVYLSDSGTVSIAADTINDGSSDNCNIDSIWLDTDSFTCIDSNDNLITLFVRDVSGNISSDTATVTVLDTTSPIVVTRDITIYLDGSGQANILPDTLDSASTDNCNIALFWLSDSSFTCGDTSSVNTITLFAQDVSGNVNSATAQVTVLDTTPPILVTNNLSIDLDSFGVISISNDSADAGTNDNCALDSVWMSQTTFTCANVGANSVTFFGVDSAGNVDSTIITVTVSDPIAPVAIAGNYTLELDSFGALTVTALDIDSGSWDSCEIASYTIDDSTFNCGDVGTTSQVVLTVTDVNGNVSIDTGSVTVEDNIAPEVITRDIVVYLDTAGSVSITAAQIDSATWDSCGLASLTLDVTSFDCGDVGTNTVTLTATDVNSNVNTGTAIVTVLDTVYPTALATPDTIFLDIFGFGIITPDSINNGSFDNCSGFTLDVSVDTVFCTDVGTLVPVDLYVTDASGNIDTATVSVYVDDTIPPVPVAQDINVLLDSSGLAVITREQVILSISDSCALDSIYINVDTVTCANAGDTLTIISTAVDTVGNTGRDTTLAFIFDSIAPALFLNDTVLYLTSDTASSGEVVIDSASLDSATFDACGLASVVHQTSFTCSDLGVNSVTVTITDVNGNVSIGTVTVTVLDTVRPVALANDTFRVLNNAGTIGVPIIAIDGGSYDNCAVTFRSRSPHVVDCDDVGFITVQLNVFDTTGNKDSVDVTVEVIDQTLPSIFTQNITISLDSFGDASITAAMLDSATTDACGIDSIWVDSTNFDCGEVGNNTVEFFAEDVNGNRDSTDVIVTVVDNIAPVVVVQNDTIALGSNGQATTGVNATLVSALDACGIDSTYLSDSVFVCGDVGSNAVVMTVVDVNGNTTNTNLTIFVIDTIPPTIQAVDTTIYLSAAGTATLDTSYVNDGTFDNCGLASFTLDSTSFDCSYADQTVTVTLTVIDVNSNVSTETVQVLVKDTVAPIAVAQNITVQLDSNGNDTIDWTDINNGSSDACGITQFMLSDSIFNCGDTGANVIELYVTDVNGNSDTVSAVVTVEDNVGPMALAFDSLFLYLDTAGIRSITANDIDSASSDSCGIDTMIISQYDYDCSDIGAPIVVTLTVTDVNGNVSTDQTVVVVADTVAPTVITQIDTVYLDAFGVVSILPANIDSGSWDSCGIATYSIDTSSFDCANTSEPVNVKLTVTDIHGNVAADSALVYVIDTVRPVIACRNDTTIFNDPGQCGALFTFDPATATDNCSIDTIIQTDGSGLVSGDEFPVGVTTIQFTATDVNGNEDSCSFTITVVDTQAPLIVCQSDTTICDSVITFALPSVIENCAVDSLVLVSGIPSGGTFPVGATTNTYAVVDESGNSDTCSYVITRIPFPTQANAGSDTSICESFVFNLDGNSPVFGTGTWTSTGGPVATDPSDPNSTVQFLNYGQNLFIWTIENGVCSPSVDSVYVEVAKTPEGSALPANISLCQEDSLTIQPEPVISGNPIWTVSTDASIADSLGDTVTITGLSLGTHIVYRAIQSGACVALRDSMLVFNNVLPTVDAGEDVTRFAGKDVSLDPIVTDVSNVAWEPADLFSSATTAQTIVSSSETSLLTIVVTSDSGCTASDSLYYIVNGLDSIPTGITPNGDGVNDVWNIPGLDSYPGAEVYVFDQAGREIFHSTGYDTPWDGTFNGNLLPRASYYWIIDLKDGVNDPLKGIISIIR